MILLNPFAHATGGGAPPTWRYVQLVITANNGDSFVSIQEIELRETVAGADVTNPSMVVTASGEFDTTNNKKENAIDNDFSTFGSGAWAASFSDPTTWSVDLGSQHPLAEIGIWAQVVIGAARAPKDFAVQARNDPGDAWTTLASFTNITGWTAGAEMQFAL